MDISYLYIIFVIINNITNMIYKYYSDAPHNIQALDEAYFWFSKHEALNDPFDMRGDFFVRFKNSRISDEKYRKQYENSVKNFSICCFSKEPLNKHLWALYASSHKGFVLGFDDDLFVDDLSLKLKSKVLYKNCEYCPSFPDFGDETTVIKTFKGEKSIKEILDSNDPKLVDDMFAYYLLIKDESIWKNEEEKRLILGENFTNAISNNNIDPGIIVQKAQNGYGIKWPKNALKEIYYGLNMEKDKINEIRKKLPENIIEKKIAINNVKTLFSLVGNRLDTP